MLGDVHACLHFLMPFKHLATQSVVQGPAMPASLVKMHTFRIRACILIRSSGDSDMHIRIWEALIEESSLARIVHGNIRGNSQITKCSNHWDSDLIGRCGGSVMVFLQSCSDDSDALQGVRPTDWTEFSGLTTAVVSYTHGDWGRCSALVTDPMRNPD